jgi:transcriptional regulator with XRE-family HTH domain
MNASDDSKIDLRIRVTTRLAWLDVTQKDFAEAIGMDKSSLSRALRANAPRDRTLQRIAIGLGLDPADLDDDADPVALISDHPVLHRGVPRSDRASMLRCWYDEEASAVLEAPEVNHRTDEERRARRGAVHQSMRNGSFDVDVARSLAERFGVSLSQIYADRAKIKELIELMGEVGDDDASTG